MATGVTMTKERRHAPRVSERIAIALSDATTALTAETTNLSSSGVYCTLDRFVAPMTKLQLELELPNGGRSSRIRCEGVVVRVEPVAANPQRGAYHVAVFFTEMTERDRSVISRFVHQRLPANS